MINHPTRHDYADAHDWKRGLILIACTTWVPVALVAVARLLVG